jgi:nucleoside-diphosphate-sugar epimerase
MAEAIARRERVLVTGATGFTGGHLARRLAVDGVAVRALVRNPQVSAASLPGIELAAGDLTDVGSLTRAVAGVDVVYHVAALYRAAGLEDESYRAVNATAVGTLIEAAGAAGVTRVIHCSTVGVHGDIANPPADEDAPLRPGDVYQETKLEGESVARRAAAAAGVQLVIVRPTGIYGPGDRRLLKLFRGVARRRFVVLGRGDIWYHLTYIDDLVDGFRLCGTHPAAAGHTYILSGPEVTTLNQLVAITAEVAGVKPLPLRLPVWPFWVAGAACEALCRPFGIEPPIYRRRVDFFTKSRAFDSSRAKTEIGYAPRVGLRDGIGRTLAWYREAGWL